MFLQSKRVSFVFLCEEAAHPIRIGVHGALTPRAQRMLDLQLDGTRCSMQCACRAMLLCPRGQGAAAGVRSGVILLQDNFQPTRSHSAVLCVPQLTVRVHAGKCTAT